MNAQTGKTSGLAITSLVFGILGLVSCCLGPLFGIPAAICGHMARSRIRTSAGALVGDGMALTGLIMGYVSLAALIVTVPLGAGISMPAVVRARDTARSAQCMNNLSQIETAKAMAAEDNQLKEGDPVPDDKLAKYVTFGSGGLTCAKDGTYTVNPVGQEPECSVHGTKSNRRLR